MRIVILSNIYMNANTPLTRKKQVGIPTKARAGFYLKGWFLLGRPLQGQGFFRQDLTGLNKIRRFWTRINMLKQD